MPMFTALFSHIILSWIQIMEQKSLTANQLFEDFSCKTLWWSGFNLKISGQLPVAKEILGSTGKQTLHKNLKFAHAEFYQTNLLCKWHFSMIWFKVENFCSTNPSNKMRTAITRNQFQSNASWALRHPKLSDEYK